MGFSLCACVSLLAARRRQRLQRHCNTKRNSRWPFGMVWRRQGVYVEAKNSSVAPASSKPKQWGNEQQQDNQPHRYFHIPIFVDEGHMIETECHYPLTELFP